MRPPDPVTMAMGMERCRIALASWPPGRQPSSSRTSRSPSATRRSGSTRSRSARCIRCGAASTETFAGAARRRLRGRRRASSSASSAATARARARCSNASPGSTPPTPARMLVDGRAGAVHRARRRLQPGPRGARQRRCSTRSCSASRQREARRALRRDHRVRRARGVRGAQAQELLVGHARAARVLGDDPGRRRRAADRRGARGRRRRVPAEVLRRVQPPARRGPHGRCSSRTTWRPCSASATARCCSSAGAS